MKIHQSNLTESNEEMANRIMTNLIKQLASLGRHANDIFGNLFNLEIYLFYYVRIRC